MMYFIITFLYEQVGASPIVREIVLGGIGAGIVGYLIRENTKLKERVKEVIDNHLSDLNKFIEDKDAYVNNQKAYLEDQQKLADRIMQALNNTKKNES